MVSRRTARQCGKYLVAAAAFASLMAPAPPVHAQDRAFQFALIGDMPYSRIEEQEFARLIGALNATDLAFVVHVGDMQVDARAYKPDLTSLPCNDEYDAWF